MSIDRNDFDVFLAVENEAEDFLTVHWSHQFVRSLMKGARVSISNDSNSLVSLSERGEASSILSASVQLAREHQLEYGMSFFLAW